MNKSLKSHQCIPGRIDVISLGCSKNLIDSERLIRRLEAKGYKVIHDPEEPCGEIVVVNTCGFIADAKEESIDTLLQLARLKEEGRIGAVHVMGCLSQRYIKELPAEIPEIDRWYGKFDWTALIDSLPSRKADYQLTPKSWERKLTTPPWSAYLKISEGCDRFCAFCAIPLITGRHTSRPIEEILEEVTALASQGVKEFNVIAQDLSSYGLDIYGKSALACLVDRIADIPGVEWIRLHYAYPADFPMDLLDVMARRDNVCKYLDIALQHASDKVLGNMRRHITARETEELLAEIRRRVPGIFIRTTLMVGFPGEGEEEFKQLLDFVRSQRFERMGAFAYCEEEDTYAAKHFSDEIPEEVKQERLDILMNLQQDISLECNEKLIGREVRALVDRREGTDCVCRTEWDSPEVDPEIVVKNCDATPGDFIRVRITEAYPYDLVGEKV